MNNTKSNPKELIKATRKNIFGSIAFRLLVLVKELCADQKKSPTQNPDEQEGLLNLANDALLVGVLCDKLLESGSPRELIFITESGEKIDLKNRDSLNDNQLADLVLDNRDNNPKN